MTDPPICDPCHNGEHWDCTPVYDPDTDEVYPCACAETGHDPGLLDDPDDQQRDQAEHIVITLAMQAAALLDGKQPITDASPLTRYL